MAWPAIPRGHPKGSPKGSQEAISSWHGHLCCHPKGHPTGAISPGHGHPRGPSQGSSHGAIPSWYGHPRRPSHGAIPMWHGHPRGYPRPSPRAIPAAIPGGIHSWHSNPRGHPKGHPRCHLIVYMSIDMFIHVYTHAWSGLGGQACCRTCLGMYDCHSLSPMRHGSWLACQGCQFVRTCRRTCRAMCCAGYAGRASGTCAQGLCWHYCGIKSEAQGFGAVCEFGCGGCWSGAGFVAFQLMPSCLRFLSDAS